MNGLFGKRARRKAVGLRGLDKRISIALLISGLRSLELPIWSKEILFVFYGDIGNYDHTGAFYTK